jgi:Skp family chaperone for outer membrane proteins
MAHPNHRWPVALIALLAATVAGCSSTYYSAWQKLGYEKRDILVSRVEKARDEQTDAKQQFKSTLDEFKSLTGFSGGDLEAEYRKLNDSYTDCESEAADVTKRINSVDKVAQAMFTEWQSELDQYTDATLKADSAAKLAESRQRYAELLTAMRNSEASMAPVLDKFHNYVLYLKHNLNASAIGSLSTTAAGIDNNVQDLIKKMDSSIDEANAFVDHLKKS